MKKYCLAALLLALVLVFGSAVPASAAGKQVAGGNLNFGLSWTLTDDGTLTVSGEGELKGGWYYYAEFQHNLPDWAYYHDTPVRKIIVEPGVTFIGDFAFAMLPYVTSVSLPDTVETIGHSAFQGCERLTSVAIPDSVTGFGIDIFLGCAKLESITLPKEMQVLPAGFLERCVSLKSIDIPDTITDIGEFALAYCRSLTSLELPEGLTRIYNNAFVGCSGLKTISLPESLVDMGSSLFEGCTSLKSITIPANVTVMGHTFQFATGLEEITFLGNAPECGSSLFQDVTAVVRYADSNKSWTPLFLETYGSNVTWETYHAEEPWNPVIATGQLGDNLTWTIHDNFVLTISGTGDMTWGAYTWDGYETRLEHIVIEPGVTSIGQQVFTGLNRVKDISIADTVTRIDAYAFSGCAAVKELVIPASVTSIGDWAFSGCSGLEKLTFLGSSCYDPVRPPFGDIEATVYYPQEDPSWTEEFRVNPYGTLTWMPMAPFPLGDADRSRVVDYLDAMLVLQMAVDLVDCTPEDKPLCDVDSSGVVDYLDAMQILRWAVGLD